MNVIQNYFIAILLSFIVMFAWGSWPNTLKMVKQNWKFQLFYWDYTIGVFLFSLIMAFTFGSFGDSGRPFVKDLLQTDNINLVYAFLGGVIFNVYNILLMNAVVIAGISVAFPVGVGLALVLGVGANYLRIPTGNLLVLMLGVLAVVLAILSTSIAYNKLTTNKNTKSAKGIIISLVSGVFGTFWYLFVGKSMSVTQVSLEVGKMGPYTSVVIFAFGLFISNFIFNTIMMKRPLSGEKAVYAEYYSGSFYNHFWGIVGGLIWGVGMSLSILASETAGFAISYGLSQTCTMIAALWGIFVWKEFKDSPTGTFKWLFCMFLFYILGILLIIFSHTT